MIHNNYKLLKKIIADEKQVETVYKPSEYWRDYSIRTTKSILKFGLSDFRSKAQILKGFGDVLVENPIDVFSGDSFKERILLKILNNNLFKKYFLSQYLNFIKIRNKEYLTYRNLYCEKLLKEWFDKFLKKHHLPPTFVGRPSNYLLYNKKKIGISYLTAFSRINCLEKFINFKKIESVFEIGGGFGAFSHSILHFYHNIKKLFYLDLCPNIYIGTQYLKFFFKKSVYDYLSTRNIKKIKVKGNKREIFPICPWQIKQVNSKVDLFVNFSSFQEMDEKIVYNYLSKLKNILNKPNSFLCIGLPKTKRKNTIRHKTKMRNKIHPSRLLQIFEEIFQTRPFKIIPLIHSYNNNAEENIYIFKVKKS